MSYAVVLAFDSFLDMNILKTLQNDASCAPRKKGPKSSTNQSSTFVDQLFSNQT